MSTTSSQNHVPHAAAEEPEAEAGEAGEAGTGAQAGTGSETGAEAGPAETRDSRSGRGSAILRS